MKCNIEGCSCQAKIKIVCISTYFDPGLNLNKEITLNKIYDAIDMETQKHVSKSHTYRIINNLGYISTHYKDYFKLLSELRDERIDEILND
jgi:hypothetical protein